MVGFIVTLVVSAIALVAAIELVPGVDFQWRDDILGLLGLALIFGLVNTLIRPIVKALALPISIFTLGLVGIVINVAMLLLTAYVAGELGLDFRVGDWPPDLTVQTIVSAVLAALLISIVSTIASLALSTRRVVGL